MASPKWLAEGMDADAEIYAAAHSAWMRVTGQPCAADYPARNESAKLIGEDGEFEDPKAMRQRLSQVAVRQIGFSILDHHWRRWGKVIRMLPQNDARTVGSPADLSGYNR